MCPVLRGTGGRPSRARADCDRTDRPDEGGGNRRRAAGGIGRAAYLWTASYQLSTDRNRLLVGVDFTGGARSFLRGTSREFRHSVGGPDILSGKFTRVNNRFPLQVIDLVESH